MGAREASSLSGSCGLMKQSADPPQQTPQKNCAIYTRTSAKQHDQNPLSSIDAQFMACAEYISIQFGRNWKLAKAFYNDSGQSGADIGREGLQSLLKDIALGLVDVVVVYRLDRLTRSVHDLQKLIQVFEAHNTTLVSVSEKIDMSSAFGKLTANILATFAGFERELIGERVKEKRSTTLQMGRWPGTASPLGYSVKRDVLVVSPEEKALVLEIFNRYANEESVTEIFRDLNSRGLTNKKWVTREGKPKGGKPFNRNSIYVLLKNRIYLGEVYYHGAWHKGDHEPIIDQALWDRVAQLLKSRSRRGPNKKVPEFEVSHLLKGMLFSADGRAISPWFSSRYKNRRYGYYVPQREIAEGAGASGLPRIPSGKLDAVVWGFIKNCLNDPGFILQCLPEEVLSNSEFDGELIARKLGGLANVIDYLFPCYKVYILKLFFRRIILHIDKIEFVINRDGLMDLILEVIGTDEDRRHYRRLFRAWEMRNRNDGGE